MHVGGHEDDEEGDAAAGPPSGRGPKGGAEVTAANDFIRDVAGRVALELATTPEGRAAGLSVELWPGRGVWLRVRTGHELRLIVEDQDDGMAVMWERSDPGPRGMRPRESQGSLGKARLMAPEDLQTFLSRWLALRVRG